MAYAGDKEFATFLNGRYMTVKDLDATCDNLKYLFDKQQRENDSLREELKALQDEAWKDEELQKMREARDKARADLNRGFSISQLEHDKIANWMRQHDAERHSNPQGYHGVSGGGFTYFFVPTGIGTVGACRCSICHSRALAAASKTGIYDYKAYEDYMETNGGLFTFQDIC